MELEALNEIRPFGEDGDDYRAAMIRQSCHGGTIAENNIIKRSLEDAAPKSAASAEDIKAKMAAQLAGMRP